jgi:ribosomal protein L11 methyltransferase
MSPAQTTLKISSLSHADALEASERIEEFCDDYCPVAVNEIDESAGLWEVVVYCDSKAAAETLQKRLESDGGFPQSSISGLPDVDWVRRSLEGLPPVIAGRFYLYGAHDRERRRSGGISLEIGAGTAFGTGHHGTTTGCLLALDAILKQQRPRKILDLGCGTGILAIAAAKVLQRSAIASDIDPEAVIVTQSNARLNGVMPLLRPLCANGTSSPILRENGPYDLVFANILARPLLALAPSLTRLTARNGHLILSGITLDQIAAIRAAYRNRGMIPRRIIRIGNWATLVLTK